MTPEDEHLALHEGPDLLRWEARALGMTMRRELNVGDAVPGVKELEDLAAMLDVAAGTNGEERRRALGKAGDADSLAMLTALIRGADGAALTGERADQQLRLETARTLRAVRDLPR
jgi:hypothetical protein